MDNSYNVDTLVTLRISIDVEAKDIKEAKEKATKVAYDSYHYGNGIWDVKTDDIEKWNEETTTWEIVEID
jgi:hypothetical protein